MQVTENEIIGSPTDENDVIVQNHKGIPENETSEEIVEDLNTSSGNESSEETANCSPASFRWYSIDKYSVLNKEYCNCNNISVELDSRINNLSDLGYDSSETHDEDFEDEVLSAEEYQTHLPNDLKIIQEGQNIGLPETMHDNKPQWFDPEKFKKGQEFAIKYYFGVNFAEMLSLLILFSFDDGFEPLIFTDRSGTPYTAFKRYLSTVLRVKTWFESDVFNTDSIAYNNLKIVRSMHESVNKKINLLNMNDVKNKLNQLTEDKNLKCPLKNAIEEDFKNSLCPFTQGSQKKTKNRTIYFNQCSMSVTQFGFIGLVITYPEKFGAANATDEELEGFIHLWKTMGYLLGVEDKYNFCNGSLIEVRNRCKDLLQYWVIPNFCNLTNEWEHFSRCMIEGVNFYVPGNSFEISILYLCYVLNIKAEKICSSVSWLTYFKLQFFKFTLCFALKFPFILNLANKSVKNALNRARNFSNEKLQRLEEISDEFMR